MATTDMHYRFLWDTEPTDAQLQAIMQEVGEDVRNVRKGVFAKMKEKLHNDFQAIKFFNELHKEKLHSDFLATKKQ